MLVVQLSRIVLDILVQKDKVIYIFASQYFGFAASKVDITSLPLCSQRLCGSFRNIETTEAQSAQRNKSVKM